MKNKSFKERPPQSVRSTSGAQSIRDLTLVVPDIDQRIHHLRTSDSGPASVPSSPTIATSDVRLNSRPVKKATTKVGGMISQEYADRLKLIAFTSKVSESAILETALICFFGDLTNDQIDALLRSHGARRRRMLS